MSDSKPWYPPGEGWIEWHGRENPVPGAVVEWLTREERRAKEYLHQTLKANDLVWRYAVAYRVVTPAPSTVDRALFDEMVEALLMMKRFLDGGNPLGMWGGIRNDAAREVVDTVLSKVREASK